MSSWNMGGNGDLLNVLVVKIHFNLVKKKSFQESLKNKSSTYLLPIFSVHQKLNWEMQSLWQSKLNKPEGKIINNLDCNIKLETLASKHANVAKDS